MEPKENQRDLAKLNRGTDQSELRTTDWANIHIDPTAEPIDPRKFGTYFSNGGYSYSADTLETLTHSWSGNF